MAAAPLVLDSVTGLPRRRRAGKVALCASHGGVYAAWYAARRGVSALILHDAGIGRERAGVGGLAGSSVMASRGRRRACSARIGDGADMSARGVLSTVNVRRAARVCGAGMAAAEALRLLCAAAPPAAEVPRAMDEARREVARIGAVRVVRSIPTGWWAPRMWARWWSPARNGGLLGNRPGPNTCGEGAGRRRALQRCRGIGADGRQSRLPALQDRGNPGRLPSPPSRAIGDGLSPGRTAFVCRAEATRRGGRGGMWPVRARVHRGQSWGEQHVDHAIGDA
jgi:hypothetical protein